MRVKLFAELQLLDRRLATLAQTSEALAEQLKEGEAVRALHELRRDRSSRLKQERGRATDLQWELDEIEARLRELAVQEREGPSDPLVARELAMLREQRNQLEDQALEQMERVETLVQELTDADTAWHERSAAWTQREPELRQEWDRLTEMVEALQHERQALRARLTPEALALYDDLQRRHRGTAIAAVRNRQCGACRARLSAAVFDLLAGPDPLVRCPRCGRVLAMPTDLGEQPSPESTPDMEQPDGSS
jgi:predicted  nucleic acid-binding Zn-ribbon protein